VPFYFFHAAARVPADAFQLEALLLGLALSAVLLPLRIGVQWLHRRIVHRESAASSLRVAIALAPTLIFTLVLAGILRERYGLSPPWYGALLVYAFVSTALPAALKRRRRAAEVAERSASVQPG
jgi:Kef-type K+ transport system membrane component KefB